MKLYEVTLFERVTYVLTVKAEDEDKAGEMAASLWAGMPSPDIQCKTVIGQGVEVCGIREVQP